MKKVGGGGGPDGKTKCVCNLWKDPIYFTIKAGSFRDAILPTFVRFPTFKKDKIHTTSFILMIHYLLTFPLT